MNENLSSSPAVMHQVLSAAVARVLGHYTDFSGRIPPDSAKEFTGFHTACKAAISHLSALLKLQKLAGMEPTANSASQEIEALLLETRNILLKTDRPS